MPLYAPPTKTEVTCVFFRFRLPFSLSSEALGLLRASLVAQTVKRLPAMRETRVRFLGREDPLEKEMAVHSSTLAWKIPWMEESDMLLSMGSQSRTRLSDLPSLPFPSYQSNMGP